MLRIENLHVDYAKIPALRGIDMDINARRDRRTDRRKRRRKIHHAEGDFRSDRAVCRQDRIQWNVVWPVLRRNNCVELGIIHVPEGRRIFPRLTVEENLRVGAYAVRARAGEKEARERVYSLFPRLAERRRQAGGSLSGGEQQMLAFGRAMMAKPVLLLLDEPSLGLAPILVEEVAQAIDRFHDDGATILLVEQNAELALSIASRGFVIETGRIVLTDTASKLLKNPKVWASYLGQEDWEAEADEERRAI